MPVAQRLTNLAEAEGRAILDTTRILQVSTGDVGGGAERIASDLHRGYLARGLDAWLAVGTRHGDDTRTLAIPRSELPAGAGPLARMSLRARRALADPSYLADRLRSLEDMSFPGTRALLGITGARPDLLHLHNLHGGYFDLRELPHLSHAVATAVTLHDTWLLAGHCAYAMDCERWRTGCDSCPDLARPVPLARDSSATNWKRKRDIYRRSRLFIAAPSRWVLARAEASMLREATVESFVVPNGIDTSVFTPAEDPALRGEVRRELGIDEDAFVVMFNAVGAGASPYKDLATVRDAVARLASDGRRVALVALGSHDSGTGDVSAIARDADGATLDTDGVTLVPFTDDRARIARYLHAADLYAHMAHAETFGLAIAEALACGVPVVASAVGGIPEVVTDGITGVLVPEGDASELARAISTLADEPERRRAMSAAGVADARERLDVARMVDGYLAMYEAMLAHAGTAGDASAAGAEVRP